MEWNGKKSKGIMPRNCKTNRIIQLFMYNFNNFIEMGIIATITTYFKNINTTTTTTNK